MSNISYSASSSVDINNAVFDCLLIEGKQYSISELEDEILLLEDEVTKAKGEIKKKVDELILKKVILREDSINKQFERFIARKTENVKNAVYLNKGLLHLAVKSYYDDIHRYKDYSGSKWANNHKQTAYTIKWIVRFKPIQIREVFDNEKYLNNEILDINLIFAMRCGFSFLDRKIIDLISNEKKEIDKHNLTIPFEQKEKEEKQSFYDKLLYTLRYRPFSGKQLISIFEALELRCS